MKTSEAQPNSHSPLQSLEEWEDFLKDRYPEPGKPAKEFQATDPNKKKEEFRNYETDARPTVREFYRQNHRHQTYEFAQAKRKEFLTLKPAQDEYLGGDGILKHPRGRQRS
jgi:inositol oxygenase